MSKKHNFKVGDKVKYIGLEKEPYLENKELMIACIDANFVGFDITEWYPEKAHDKFYNGKDTNWPLYHIKEIQFELVNSKVNEKKEIIKQGWGF